VPSCTKQPNSVPVRYPCGTDPVPNWYLLMHLCRGFALSRRPQSGQIPQCPRAARRLSALVPMRLRPPKRPGIESHSVTAGPRSYTGSILSLAVSQVAPDRRAVEQGYSGTLQAALVVTFASSSVMP
jgi:hypothetical protein